MVSMRTIADVVSARLASEDGDNPSSVPARDRRLGVVQDPGFARSALDMGSFEEIKELANMSVEKGEMDS